MAAARLALLLPALLAAFAQGLKLVTEQAALEGSLDSSRARELARPARKEAPAQAHKAEGTKKKTQKLGVVGASTQWLKAKAEIARVTAELDEMKYQYDVSINETEHFAALQEKFERKAQELMNEREERKKMKGHHVIYNKELAEARKQNGDINKTGLWIITDEPDTHEDRERERWRRGLRKMHPQDYNITDFVERAKLNARGKLVQEVWAHYYSDKIAELNAELQEAMGQASQSSSVIASKRAEAKEKAATKRKGKAAEQDSGEEEGEEEEQEGAKA